jgi:hypothetical protein
MAWILSIKNTEDAAQQNSIRARLILNKSRWELDLWSRDLDDTCNGRHYYERCYS